jgi:hypothetical protein
MSIPRGGAGRSPKPLRAALEIISPPAKLPRETIRLLLFLTLYAAAFAQRTTPAFEPNSAIAAIRLLPKDVQKRLARVEARDGTPWPARWYLLVHDPAEARGLREFVVADGELKAGRGRTSHLTWSQ